ncbi:NAD-glutamate dehydrogenase [Nigerium massiliense]|uniref:NAD-glutamate dehydrogenase n=1 Tax=Nigerium massiliense TaxID=1522317 RepID=UPI0012FDADD5|nr:NAD-glutamate dehydrogenase [Nigerium massiliense]
MRTDVLSSAQLLEFASAYFARNGVDEMEAKASDDLSGLLEAHLALGRRRRPDEDRVSVTTPTSGADGWSAQGSTVIQIVTKDRPFLVDTVLMDLTRDGWSVRHLYHPQFAVTRDADGVLTGLTTAEAGDAPRESWMGIEVYPPLGESAGDLTAALTASLGDRLERVREVVDDWGLMRERAAECIEMLDNNPQPVSPHRVHSLTSLLQWLVDDHFAFLGYREYTVDGTTFTPVEGTGLGLLREEDPDEFSARAPGKDDDDVIVITKAPRRSPVHRPAYLDYLGVRVFDRTGKLVGERRFLGLLSSTAYAESVEHIPVLRERAKKLAELSGFEPNSHGGHVVQQIINTFPRDELFQASVSELAPVVDSVVSIQERRRVRLFLRASPYGHFLTAVVYLPRDRYTTTVRLRLQRLLLEALGGETLEYQVQVSESVLARLFFVVKLPDGAVVPDVDVVDLERRVNAATRSWDDDFNEAADELPAQERGVEFGEAYEAVFSAQTALADLQLANQLRGEDDLQFSLYEQDGEGLRFKVFSRQEMSLTDVLPHLAVLGVEVTDERPFTWDLRGEPVHVYDFGFRLGAGESASDWDAADRDRFCEAFAASYRGQAHPGQLNRLVMGAKLTWRQVSWLRGISRYLQQAGIPFSQVYVAAALNDHPRIAAALVDAFETRFAPGGSASLEERTAAFDERIAAIEEMLDDVASLDQDRIVRMFVSVLRALVRTNAFADDQPALAFKILPQELSLLPQPRPAFEIFVVSPRVQGVHLRFGAVARGGLRWSDRMEDFRTEILGLVKAQMVKNTVIAPVGAKGGFVPQHLPDPRTDRAGWAAEGLECYKLFIASLLSVTDNLVDGQTVPPPDVVRYDGDDSYLVVAADKGTASFSDTANAIALERGFWLGDAFASGGSVGYDHKKMGITARGAWESVKRHFYEAGVDCQNEDFTCVGIGDMAGDVFGNGMLRSRHTKLVAAFNHQHIFLDPDPDPEASFAERERLFHLDRSTWADYDASLISPGGGVYERTLKAITLTPQVRAVLGLEDAVEELTPTQLITAILKAPVDLLWNGGIGTYVKSAAETNADVGDKANDAVRVNGGDVRARVAGEGGNLGWTQAGRIEYAHNGGRINTDFIDNSAGVDTSDHEVNIKILLAPLVKSGRLSDEQRVALLESMTDDVARHVLDHNIDQNLALAASETRAEGRAAAHEGWMRELEASGHLVRELESLPSSEEMAERIARGEGLTRPELATLLSWTKIRLAELVLDSGLPDDPYLADRLLTYFPKAMRADYADEMRSHPLHREIITTITVNRFVNSQGPSAYYRLGQETQAGIEQIVRAQLAARAIFQVAKVENKLAKLKLPADVDTSVRVALQRMVERAARWLLHNRRSVDPRAEVARLTDPVSRLLSVMPDLFTPVQRELTGADAADLREHGVDEAVVERASVARFAHFALLIAEVTDELDRDPELVARVTFGLLDRLHIDKMMERVDELAHTDQWSTMARAALRDDLEALVGQLVRKALETAPEASEAEDVVAGWLDSVGGGEAEAAFIAQICEGSTDLAKMSVALRSVRSLLA